MKTQPNDPANVIDGRYAADAIRLGNTGLTKRETFAAMANGNTDGLSTDVMELIVGEKMPSSPLDRINFFICLEAKYKVMHADALIEALNKE